MNQPVTLIAEVGCNHRGDFDTALEMIRVAADFCGVDAVKFQKRTPAELLTQGEYDAPHPDPVHAYGSSYGEHRDRLELSLDQHRELQEECERCGVAYSSSVWDATSARAIISLQPRFIKIPSACNLDFNLIGLVTGSFAGEIHLSVGMTTRGEEDRIVDFFVREGREKSLVLYSCTSGYPVSFEDICLLEISRLREKFGTTVKAIGFSGHHLGIAADVAAMTLGAEYVERHFTLDRTWKGTDHAASLEPDGLRRLARDLQNVGSALRCKPAPILPVEEVQRKKLKRGAGTASLA